MYTIGKINIVLRSLTDRLSKLMCLACLIILFIPINLSHFATQSTQVFNLPNIFHPQTEKLHVHGSNPQRPLYVDSRLQIAKLIASDGSASDFFGYSVAISGETIAVGAHGDDDDVAGADAGSVYVFERSGDDWESITQVAKLTPQDAQPSEFLAVCQGLCKISDPVSLAGMDIRLSFRLRMTA